MTTQLFIQITPRQRRDLLIRLNRDRQRLEIEYERELARFFRDLGRAAAEAL